MVPWLFVTSLPKPSPFLPKGLCTCCSFCVECSVFQIFSGWLFLIIQVSAQISLSWKGLPWSLYLKLITIWSYLFFYMSLVCLLLESELQEGRCFLSLLFIGVLQSLKQNLIKNLHYVNMYWMNEWIRESFHLCAEMSWILFFYNYGVSGE